MRTVLLACLAACTTTDYGTPTADTTVSVEIAGGFSPEAGPSFHITGLDVVYTAFGRTGTAQLSTAQVASIIDALESADFLARRGDYTRCDDPALDASTATIFADVTAGTNRVALYLGCDSVYGDLHGLETTLLDLSGLTAWEQTQ